MTELTQDEENIVTAIKAGAYEDALEMWSAYQESEGICDNGSCESQSEKRICCASHLHGRLFTLAVVNSNEELSSTCRKLGNWIKDQEISNAIPQIVGKKPLSLPNSLLTGHPAVDYEHRQLINILNRFSATLDQSDYEASEVQITFFFNLLVKHFENEEKILIDVGFPEADRHKEFHDQLRSKAAKYIEVTHNLKTDDHDKDNVQSEMIAMLFDDAIKADIEFKSFLMDKGYVA